MKASIFWCTNGQLLIKVHCVKSPLKGEAYKFYCTTTEDRPDLARLLMDHIQSELNDTLETIRKEAYELAWKTAKAKRKKHTDFNSCWQGEPAW